MKRLINQNELLIHFVSNENLLHCSSLYKLFFFFYIEISGGKYFNEAKKKNTTTNEKNKIK